MRKTGIFLAIMSIFFFLFSCEEQQEKLEKKKGTKVVVEYEIPEKGEDPGGVFMLDIGGEENVFGEFLVEKTGVKDTFIINQERFNIDGVSVPYSDIVGSQIDGTMKISYWMEEANEGKTALLDFSFKMSTSKVVEFEVEVENENEGNVNVAYTPYEDSN